MSCLRFRTSKLHGQSFSLVTVKGDEYTFASPNAQIVTQLLCNFIDGLRRRSIYAVGLDPFVGQSKLASTNRYENKLELCSKLFHTRSRFGFE